MSNFEDAMHQGFSRGELAQEMAEFEKRMIDLECSGCAYVERGFKTCLTVIDSADIYSSCPYRKQKKEEA